MKKIILFALVMAMILVSFVGCRDKGPVETDPKDPAYFPGFTPDYPAPPVDSGADNIGDGNDDKLEAPEGGGAVGLIYTKEVTIDLSDKSITLRFDNPTKSTQNMSLQIVLQGIVIAESGLIEPGKRITRLELPSEIATQLAAGVYENNAKFLVKYYDPETNECAIIQTEIEIVITVQE